MRHVAAVKSLLLLRSHEPVNEKRMPGYWRSREIAEAIVEEWNRRGDGRYETRTNVTARYGNSTYRRLKSYLIYRVR